jgi:p-hydroxybenzoate 3-monooxygenase
MPESTEFDKKRSLGELESLTRSRFSQQALAEGYTGWEYEASDWS